MELSLRFSKVRFKAPYPSLLPACVWAERSPLLAFGYHYRLCCVEQ